MPMTTRYEIIDTSINFDSFERFYASKSTLKDVGVALNSLNEDRQPVIRVLLRTRCRGKTHNSEVSLQRIPWSRF